MLFNPDFSELDDLVPKALAEKAVGVFIVPVWSHSDHSVGSWYKTLRSYACAIVGIPRARGVFRNSFSELPRWPLQAIFVDFGIFRPPSVVQAEPLFDISPLNIFAFVESGSTILGPVPFLLPKLLSPLDSGDPLVDDSKASAPCSFSNLIPVKPTLPCFVDVAAFKQVCRSYPHRPTADFVSKGLSEGFGNFLGNRSICVSHPNTSSARGNEEYITSKFTEAVGKGRMLGPFSSIPFPNSWCSSQPHTIPVGVVPKHKWSPHDGELRIVSNASKGGSSSLNELAHNPAIHMLWFSFAMICSIIASLGRNTIVIAADVKAAYTILPLKISELHLFVRKIGNLFFVNRCNPFGWRDAYWNFESIAGVSIWALYLADLSFVCNFVDNFFCFVPPTRAGGPDWISARRQRSLFFGTFRRLGLPMHEQQFDIEGITCLGWILSPNILSSLILVARRQQICGILKRWTVADTSISLTEIRSVTGILFFVSNGFFLGRATIAALFKLKAATEAIAARTHRPPHKVKAKLSHQAASAIRFWFIHFSRWDGSRPLAVIPGPGSTWSQIWRGDASTEFGLGAVNDTTGSFFSLKWLVQERADAMRNEKESSSFLEALCCLYQLRFWGQSARGNSILLECDCRPAVQAISKGYSPEEHLNEVANDFHHLVAFHSISLCIRHIPRTKNKIPDLLSRGPECLAEALTVWRVDKPDLGVRVRIDRSSLGRLFSRS
jgi:hypothetical protein